MALMTTFLKQKLSARISLMVVLSTGILLMLSLSVMLYYSRKAIKEEVLHKATHTLEGTVEHIDNTLLSVEQSAGIVYFNLMPYINNPEKVLHYCRELVEANSHVSGCAVAFKKDYLKDHPYYMAWVHRLDGSKSSLALSDIIEETDTTGVYLDQPWFEVPMSLRTPGWQRPMVGEDTDEIPVITFCLPIISSDGEPIGVMGVGVSLSKLSDIIMTIKPSPNSYCVLVDSDGTYIVHPNGTKLHNQRITDYSQEGTDARRAAESMLSGATDHVPFHLDGTKYFVFYQPFERTSVAGRTMEKMRWSVGIVYPENDIYGDYNKLLLYVLAIALVSLLLLYILCQKITHRQLKPLLMLTDKAHYIAKGHYDSIIPDTRQEDEIGLLQQNFQEMQKSLASHMGELEQLTATLKENKLVLEAAYNQAAKADHMKTAFLHNMTNQMVTPSHSIEKDVKTLVEKVSHGDTSDISKLAEEIQNEGKVITDLLRNLINTSDEDKVQSADTPIGKEAADD
jgi:HAMP domain-containing protein